MKTLLRIALAVGTASAAISEAATIQLNSSNQITSIYGLETSFGTYDLCFDQSFEHQSSLWGEQARELGHDLGDLLANYSNNTDPDPLFFNGGWLFWVVYKVEAPEVPTGFWQVYSVMGSSSGNLVTDGSQGSEPIGDGEWSASFRLREAIPEPGSTTLGAAALIGLACRRRRAA